MKVRFARPANRHLVAILEHISVQSPQGARSVARRIKALTAGLADQPFLGMQVHESGLRRLVVRPFPYLIYYEVQADEVIVVAICHAARDPATMPDAPKGSA